MATGNFLNINSSKIFAVEIENEWDYDDLKMNLDSELEESIEGYNSNERYENYNRSFPGVILGSVADEVLGDGELGSAYINIDIIVRSGYYSGVNLDWNLNIQCDNNYDYDNIDEIEKKHFEGIFTDEYSKFIRKIENAVNDNIEKIEKVFENNSIKLGVVARFSNGETIYEKV